MLFHLFEGSGLFDRLFIYPFNLKYPFNAFNPILPEGRFRCSVFVFVIGEVAKRFFGKHFPCKTPPF